MILLQVHLQQPCYDFSGLQQHGIGQIHERFHNRETSAPLAFSILPLGSCGGRCVRMAGTYSRPVHDRSVQGIPRSRNTVAGDNPHCETALADFPICLKVGTAPWGQPRKADGTHGAAGHSFTIPLYCACGPGHLGALQTYCSPHPLGALVALAESI